MHPPIHDLQDDCGERAGMPHRQCWVEALPRQRTHGMGFAREAGEVKIPTQK